MYLRLVVEVVGCGAAFVVLPKPDDVLPPEPVLAAELALKLDLALLPAWLADVDPNPLIELRLLLLLPL